MSYNTSSNGEMRWDGDGEGAGDGDDVDDNLDDAHDDGYDLLCREVFSPTESARRRCLFFSIGFHHEAAEKLRNSSSFMFSTPRG